MPFIFFVLFLFRFASAACETVRKLLTLAGFVRADEALLLLSRLVCLDLLVLDGFHAQLVCVAVAVRVLTVALSLGAVPNTIAEVDQEACEAEV